MNEIDLKTKIEGLEKAIKDHVGLSDDYKVKLADAKQKLKDLYKPELTPSQMDDVYEAVEKAVDSYDFSDTDNYEIDYGIDYDGRINCESHEFINESDLVQMIVDKVCTLFKEVEDESTDTK